MNGFICENSNIKELAIDESYNLKEALENLNIRLKEHYIIADGTYSGVFHDDYTMAQKINRI